MSRIFDIAYEPDYDPYASTVDDISYYTRVQSVSEGGTFLDKIAPSAANFPNALAGTPSRYFLYLPRRIDRSDLSGSRPITVTDETTATALTRVTASPSTNEYRIPPENSIRRNAVELHSGQAGHTISYDYYGIASMFTAEEWNKRHWVNSYSTASDYTITDSDFYDDFDVAHTSSTPLITLSLPTVADNEGRIIRITNTGDGLTKVDCEGAETLLFKRNSLAQIYLFLKGDYIWLRSDGSQWIEISHSINIWYGWQKRNDWTNVHVGSAFTYDNKSSGVDFTGQKLTLDSGNTCICLEDSGGTGVSGILYVYLWTGTGVAANNEQIATGQGSYTADVDEGSGTSKNINYDLYHELGLNKREIKLEEHISTDGTEANSMELRNTTVNSVTVGHTAYQTSTNSIKIQSHGSGYDNIVLDSGATNQLDTDDYYISLKITA